MSFFYACMLSILSAIASYFHMVYSADKVAAKMGHFVSIGVIPFVVGGLLGLAVSVFMAKISKQRIKQYWWCPVVGSVAALTPVAFILWAMSQPVY